LESRRGGQNLKRSLSIRPPPPPRGWCALGPGGRLYFPGAKVPLGEQCILALFPPTSLFWGDSMVSCANRADPWSSVMGGRRGLSALEPLPRPQAKTPCPTHHSFSYVSSTLPPQTTTPPPIFQKATRGSSRPFVYSVMCSASARRGSKVLGCWEKKKTTKSPFAALTHLEVIYTLLSHVVPLGWAETALLAPQHRRTQPGRLSCDSHRFFRWLHVLSCGRIVPPLASRRALVISF